MKVIHKFIEQMKEELEGARNYAEKYLEHKARGEMAIAKKYAEMAEDELKHATYIKEITTGEVEELKKVYKFPESLDEEWIHAHKHFAECMAITKQMLLM